MPSDLDELHALAKLSRQLVGAAERQDWDTLAELGKDYFAAFARLTAAPAATGDATARRQLIQRLLADHEAIREMAEPWLRSTGRLLGRWNDIAAKSAATPQR